MGKSKVRTKIIPGTQAHTFQCDICYEMERRGYKSEERYWDDLFSDCLKPIKFKLIMQVDKKTFDQWLVCLERQAK